MIRTWKHKGLQRFFEDGDDRRIDQNMKKRIYQRLQTLHKARSLEELKASGHHFHRWTGGDTSILSLNVSGNWRILFRWHKGDAYDVDLADPHS